FERDQFQNHSVVIDSVSSMETKLIAERRVVKSNSGSKVVKIGMAVAFVEGFNKRIDIPVSRIVLYVRVDLISETKIESQISAGTPIILNEAGNVIVVHTTERQIPIRNTASKRNCKQQIAVIDLSVAVMIKGGKIFDKLDSSLPEYAKINTRLNDLKFTAEFESVVSDDLGDIIADLHAILLGRLRYAEA